MRQMAVWLFLGAVGFLLSGSPPWLWFAVASSAFLGLLILFDALFFKEGEAVYRNEWEPTVVSGFVQLVPWLVVPWFVEVSFTEVSLLAMLAGFLSMASLIPYFRAIKLDQDAVVVTIMWSLVIAVVPALGFIFLGETLSFRQYVGIGMLFLGAIFAVWRKDHVRRVVVGLMLVAVVISSFHNILAKEALDITAERESFWNIFLFFALGENVVAWIALVVVRKSDGSLAQLGGLVKRFWIPFLFVEFCQVAFAVTSWRAISLGPVSLVTAIGGLAGAFVVVLSILVALLFRGTKYEELTRAVEKKQTSGIRRKCAAIAILVVGAYLAASD